MDGCIYPWTRSLDIIIRSGRAEQGYLPVLGPEQGRCSVSGHLTFLAFSAAGLHEPYPSKPFFPQGVFHVFCHSKVEKNCHHKLCSHLSGLQQLVMVGTEKLRKWLRSTPDLVTKIYILTQPLQVTCGSAPDPPRI